MPSRGRHVKRHFFLNEVGELAEKECYYSLSELGIKARELSTLTNRYWGACTCEYLFKHWHLRLVPIRNTPVEEQGN